ncbi:MAG: MBL fold metallo-hydrolase [Clostridia bacterium]|nr:MBL fold metallo-hydrolase [Clostridia bacterium]
MAFERAIIKQIRPNVWLIDDAGESTCFLIAGRDKALLVDTANGYEDLAEIVRSLTSLPVVVVNTHGHGDHILGNAYFGEAWMHPADFALYEMFAGYAREQLERLGLGLCPLKPLSIGQVFDLGGVQLEVVDLKGHTEGSVGLLDKAGRILYTGDGLNTHLWMQLDHSLPVSVLLDTFLKLKEEHGADFDHIAHGHAKELRGREVLDWMIAGCEDILAGRTENDLPYEYFGGVCRQHPITGVPGEVIVYNEGGK